MVTVDKGPNHLKKAFPRILTNFQTVKISISGVRNPKIIGHFY